MSVASRDLYYSPSDTLPVNSRLMDNRRTTGVINARVSISLEYHVYVCYHVVPDYIYHISANIRKVLAPCECTATGISRFIHKC